MANKKEELIQELSDEELNHVIGGVDYQRKYEIELGDLVPDAYRPEKKNTDPTKIDMGGFNTLNQNINIDNNYEPLKYEDKNVNIK